LWGTRVWSELGPVVAFAEAAAEEVEDGLHDREGNGKK
jgi:hypothetical protein